MPASLKPLLLELQPVMHLLQPQVAYVKYEEMLYPSLPLRASAEDELQFVMQAHFKLQGAVLLAAGFQLFPLQLQKLRMPLEPLRPLQGIATTWSFFLARIAAVA